jgi:hypothetical protein
VEEEDYEREPEDSSSDTGSAEGSKMGGFKRAAVFDFDEPKVESKERFRQAPEIVRTKSPEVKKMGDEQLDEDMSGDEIFAEQRKPKRPRTYQRNIHAVAPAKKKADVFVRKGHGSRDRGRAEQEKETAKTTGFKIPKVDLQPAKPKAKFVKHTLPATQDGGLVSSQGSAPELPTLGGADGSSSPLSSLDASPDRDPTTFECETCSQRVSKLLREEYEDEYVNGRQWTMKRQERFCEWHRRQTASETWKERGYPEIDWTGLARRMRKHDSFLILVLNDEVASKHRNDFKKLSRSKVMKGAMKNNAKPGASVGYYGPKGEKMM